MKKIFLVFLSLAILLLSYSIYGENIPKYVLKEKRTFLKQKLSPTDDIFLKDLTTAFTNIAKLNSALDFFSPIIKINSEDTTYKRATRLVKRQTRRVIKKKIMRHRTLLNLRTFIFLNLKGSGYEEKLLELLNDIEKRYNRLANINRYIEKSTLPSTGGKRILQISLKSFEYTLGEKLQKICKDTTQHYEELGILTYNYEFEKIKNSLKDDRKYFLQRIKILKEEILDHLNIYSMKDWYTSIFNEIFELIALQWEFNRYFSQAILEKFENTHYPSEPRLPDLTIKDWEIKKPKNFFLNRYIKIIIDVENTGDLTIKPSRILLLYPDGRTRQKKIPALKAKEVYSFVQKYKVRTLEDNTFKAVLNYNFKTWESDYNNNIQTFTLSFIPDLEVSILPIKDVSVNTPTKIKILVKNKGNIGVKKASVTLNINSQNKKRKTIRFIREKSSKIVTFKYKFPQQGKYTLYAEVKSYEKEKSLKNNQTYNNIVVK